MINLYNNPDTYTQQIMALESYCTQNPKSALDHLVFVHHDMTQLHDDESVAQFKTVSTLQLGNSLTSQLVQQVAPANHSGTNGQIALEFESNYRHKREKQRFPALSPSPRKVSSM